MAPTTDPDASEALSRALARLVSGPQGDAIRMTAATLMHEHIDRGRRGLALCAAASGAGVTFVTAALGMALAQEGVSVLIVEANLRRPALHDLIAPSEPGDAGLLQYLLGETDTASDIIQHDVLPNLSIAYAGGSSVGAQDLFDGERLGLFLQPCLRSFSVTLIDTPPANRCAEARAIASAAGYAAIVVRGGVSLSSDVVSLLADLQMNRVDVVGTIFNDG